VSTRRDDLARKFFLGMALPTLHLQHVSTTDRNWKRQSTGGALAVTKVLVRQVKGWWGNSPLHFVWSKCHECKYKHNTSMKQAKKKTICH